MYALCGCRPGISDGAAEFYSGPHQSLRSTEWPAHPFYRRGEWGRGFSTGTRGTGPNVPAAALSRALRKSETAFGLSDDITRRCSIEAGQLWFAGPLDR